MIEKFEPVSEVSGELYFDGDKSISHRTLIFSAMAEGESVIRNINRGLDVRSTMDCLRQLGAEIADDGDQVLVRGVGFRGFRQPELELNAGNSGTTARLLSGLLSVQNFPSTLIGDESLSKRPMKRVCEPLRLMGAQIKTTNGFLPVSFFPSEEISHIKFEMNIPSAQVKTALVLAGLHIEEDTIITEPAGSRDHTEKMLGLPVRATDNGNLILVNKSFYPVKNNYFVPGDISSASFFIVLGLLAENSNLLIKNVLLNTQRIAFISHLQKMGAKITLIQKDISAGEPYGDIRVESSTLQNIELSGNEIPMLIDEIPVLSVAALFSEGKFILKDAHELRVKESDRINSVVVNLRKLGLEVDESNDGFSFSPGFNIKTEPVFETFGDHRIAMTFVILSVLLKDGAKINNLGIVKISNPEFFNQLKSISR